MHGDVVSSEMDMNAPNQTTALGATPSGCPVVAFGPLEQRLYDYLASERPAFAPRFAGAIRVLGDVQNPERIRQAAHTMREIMTDLENFWSEQHKDLTKRLNSLISKLAPLRSAATKFSNLEQVAENELNDTRVYITASEVFLNDYITEQSVLNGRVEVMLSKIDAAFATNSPGWRSELVKEWRFIKKQLVKIAHGSSISVSEFIELKDNWVRFLVTRMRPETTANQNDIMALITETETPHAND